MAWLVIVFVPLQLGRPQCPTADTLAFLNLAQESHSSIIINGDADFTSQSITEGWQGNGTASSPYVIDNYTISSLEYALSISQVSVSFVIRRCRLTSVFLYGPCVSLNNVSNAVIELCIINSFAIGVGLYLVRNCTLNSNWIGGGRESLSLRESYSCTFTNNVLPNGGISFDSADLAGFRHTFSNNTVVSRPLGYFYNVTGWNIDASSFGQLFIIGSDHCYVSTGNFRDVPYGVLLVGCQDCELVSCVAYQSRYGVVILTSGNVTISNCSLSSNLYSGLSINRSSNCFIFTNSIYSNRGFGIDVLGPNVRIVSNLISSNEGGILAIPGNGEVQTYGGLVVYNDIHGNTKHGILLQNGVSGFRVYGNWFHSNAPNAWDDASGNQWDDGIGMGNAWDDYYYDVGFYQVGGTAISIDHYANGTVLTNPSDFIPGEITLALWGLSSAALLGIAALLIIRTKGTRLGTSQS